MNPEKGGGSHSSNNMVQAVRGGEEQNGHSETTGTTILFNCCKMGWLHVHGGEETGAEEGDPSQPGMTTLLIDRGEGSMTTDFQN